MIVINRHFVGISPFFFKDYLSDAKGACNGPPFRDITSITDEQLGAFVSLLAVNHGLPFCSICDSMVNQAEKELFAPTSEKLSVSNMIYFGTELL